MYGDHDNHHESPQEEGIWAKIVCPISVLKANVAAILFVDDTDIIHLNMQGNESVVETHRALQDSVRSWGDLLIALGGALKLAKCFSHILSFCWKKDGTWKYEANEEDDSRVILVPTPGGGMCH